MIEYLLSPIAKEIWTMLDYPEDWMFDVYEKSERFIIIHKETHIALWISNGRFFLDGYKTSVWRKDENDHTVFWFETKKPHIGVFDRHILWFKVKNVIKCLRNLEKKDDTLLTVLIEFNRNKK